MFSSDYFILQFLIIMIYVVQKEFVVNILLSIILLYSNQIYLSPLPPFYYSFSTLPILYFTSFITTLLCSFLPYIPFLLFLTVYFISIILIYQFIIVYQLFTLYLLCIIHFIVITSFRVHSFLSIFTHHSLSLFFTYYLLLLFIPTLHSLPIHSIRFSILYSPSILALSLFFNS